MVPSVPPVTPHIGRPSGRELTDLELRHLRFLLDIRSRATEGLHTFNEQLEDFVLELLDSGASTRVMEGQIGVPYRTIQEWKKNAQQRRGMGHAPDS